MFFDEISPHQENCERGSYIILSDTAFKVND